jgi:hypothetical protein
LSFINVEASRRTRRLAHVPLLSLKVVIIDDSLGRSSDLACHLLLIIYIARRLLDAYKVVLCLVADLLNLTVLRN